MLVGGEFGIDWERNDLARVLRDDREIGRRVAEVGIRFEERQWHGEVPRSFHTLLFQEDLKLVAARSSEDVVVKDVRRAGADLRRGNFRDPTEQFVVCRGALLAGAGPGVEVRELGGKDRGLQAVEPAAHALHQVFVFVHAVGSVVGKHPHFLRQSVVIGDDRSRVAVGTEVFSGVKAEGPGDANGAHAPPAEGREMRLRAVFHDVQSAALRDFHDDIHLRWLAEQMHRQDRLGARGDRRLDLRRVEIVAVVLHVHEDDLRSGQRDGFRRGDPTVTRGDDLIAWPDAEHFQRDENGVRAIAAAHAVLHAVFLRVGFFKVGDILAADERGLADHRGDGRVNLGAVRAILCFQVNEGNVHGWWK